MSNFVDMAALNELPDKGFIVKTRGDTQVVIAKFKGEVYAVENLCSHAFARFDEGGRLRANRLMCPLHGACFNITNGETFGPPASQPIRSFDVQVESDRVLVDLGDG